MDFELSADQVALREAAAALLDGVAGPAEVRAHTERGDALHQALWAAMAEQGWLGIEAPESAGGLGLGAVEVAVLAEAVGAHIAPAPFVSSVLAVAAAHAAGADDLVARLLDGAVACIAWSRDQQAVVAIEGAATGDVAVTGVADPTPYAPVADVAVVVARDAGGADGLFAVDLRATGRPAREPAMDVTRPVGWLRFDATPARRLGGPDAVVELVDRGATFVAAELLGSATRVLDLSVEYAKERVQFGRPIGSFQAVKHRCADMLVDVEGMRSTVYWAAWCIGARDRDASIAASSAKSWCSEASKRVMASALQVHGGIGFTWEHDLHFFLKRAQLDQLLFGDASFHLARLGALLRPRVAAGESVV
ncbi:MAG TPA: acyl-CoA dehydrogenase family protein [Acidimicrobiia bacterium]|nr:acyl-CoA dehydrogenase family protein [Acidimicrobiia bacterium]